MPIVVLLPLIFSAVGALNAGYTFLLNIEHAHPGSMIQPEHMDELQRIAPEVHQIVAEKLSAYNEMDQMEKNSGA